MRRVRGAAFLATAFAAGLAWAGPLRAQPHPEPAFPPPAPRYEVRMDSSAMVPMRDGVGLSTDILFPIGAGDRLPAILIRTPYDKNRYTRRPGAGIVYTFAGQGYVVLIQDTRGRYESEGEFVISAADREDGFDAVEWITRQP